MKNVGIPRRLDELGRIVIPIDVRRALSLNERDTVMFFLDEKSRTVVALQTSCEKFSYNLQKRNGA